MASKELGLIRLHPNGEEAQTRGDHEGDKRPQKAINGFMGGVYYKREE